MGTPLRSTNARHAVLVNVLSQRVLRYWLIFSGHINSDGTARILGPNLLPFRTRHRRPSISPRCFRHWHSARHLSVPPVFQPKGVILPGGSLGRRRGDFKFGRNEHQIQSQTPSSAGLLGRGSEEIHLQLYTLHHGKKTRHP